MQAFNNEFLRKVVEEENLSQAELARRMGVSRACVTRILQGKRQPSVVFLAGLRRIFPQHSLDYFFDARQDE